MTAEPSLNHGPSALRHALLAPALVAGAGAGALLIITLFFELVPFEAFALKSFLVIILAAGLVLGANLALAQKIKALEESETRLRDQQSLMSSVLNHMAEAVMVADAQGQLVRFNPAATRLFGSGPKPLPACMWPGFYGVFAANGINLCASDQFPLTRALRGELVDGEEMLIRRSAQDDGQTWVTCSARPIRDQAGKIVGAVSVLSDITQAKTDEQERNRLIHKLQNALGEIKTLRGIVPICSCCKKIRNDQGYWEQLEQYIRNHTDAQFSHGMCNDCGHKFYGDFWEEATKEQPHARVPTHEPAGKKNVAVG